MSPLLLNAVQRFEIYLGKQFALPQDAVRRYCDTPNSEAASKMLSGFLAGRSFGWITVTPFVDSSPVKVNNSHKFAFSCPAGIRARYDRCVADHFVGLSDRSAFSPSVFSSSNGTCDIKSDCFFVGPASVSRPVGILRSPHRFSNSAGHALVPVPIKREFFFVLDLRSGRALLLLSGSEASTWTYCRLLLRFFR